MQLSSRKGTRQRVPALSWDVRGRVLHTALASVARMGSALQPSCRTPGGEGYSEQGHQEHGQGQQEGCQQQPPARKDTPAVQDVIP